MRIDPTSAFLIIFLSVVSSKIIRIPYIAKTKSNPSIGGSGIESAAELHPLTPSEIWKVNRQSLTSQPEDALHYQYSPSTNTNYGGGMSPRGLGAVAPVYVRSTGYAANSGFRHWGGGSYPGLYGSLGYQAPNWNQYRTDRNSNGRLLGGQSSESNDETPNNDNTLTENEVTSQHIAVGDVKSNQAPMAEQLMEEIGQFNRMEDQLGKHIVNKDINRRMESDVFLVHKAQLRSDNADRGLPVALPRQQMEKPMDGRSTFGDVYFVGIVAGCSAAAIFGVISAGYCFYKFQQHNKAAADVDYPAYGVVGPATKEANAAAGNVSPSGDRKLAQSAQMYHYHHQKQQMIASEKAATSRHTSASDVDSEEENEEGDYTVYECPGLASTGEMEVKNPLFQDDITPVSSPQISQNNNNKDK